MKYKQSMFEGVPKKQLNKSRFNLSHQWKGSFDPGWLVPVLTEEMMPGDEIELSSEYMFRYDSLYYPIMVLMTMRADTVWCPNRILWPEGTDTNVGWKRWIAEQEEIIPPYVNADMEFLADLSNPQTLAFMGIPLLLSGGSKTTVIPNLNAFALAAYLAWWDEYERNPLLEDEKGFPLVAGNNTAAFITAFGTNAFPVLKSKWMKDYLTSAIPTPQLGEEQRLPIDTLEASQLRRVDTGANPPDDNLVTVSGRLETTNGTDVYVDNAGTIRELRLAEVLQAFYERIAKVGTRYRDWIKAFFRDDPEPGVVDVPVLIRSTFGRVQISDVMTTANGVNFLAEGDIQVGEYRGVANLYEPGNTTIRYNCKEHGYLLQILQVNADTSYGQGIARHWRRSVQQDYPMDIFSGIGDQEILKEEVLYNSITAQLAMNQDTFGYIPRFSEMRYRNNIHVGIMNYENQKSMHLGRIWDIDQLDYNDLEIDVDFVTALADISASGYGGLRLIDNFKTLPVRPELMTPVKAIIKAHIFHSLKVNRALPVYSTPGKGI